ncbi:LuxR C-terminal-related transcriptional regulator [Alphaproteobacteria bacterium]|nr:LuxR C-terminal-related transcriptional regulator [Alphaproteobacteria bacterium]
MDGFSHTLEKLGVNYFCILGGPKIKNRDCLTVFYSSFPKEWVNYYQEQGFAEKNPIFQDFSDPSKSMYFCDTSDPNLQFMKKCRDFDINYRLAFFIRNYTWHYLVSFSFKEPCETLINSLSQRHLLETICWLLTSQIHEKNATLESSPSLTKRELECLRWASEGKTSEETALILSLSHWTVSFHLKNAYKKLGVYSKSAAVLKAIKLGLL